MQVSFESKGTVLREVKVGLPGSAITQEVNNRLQQLAKKARVDGFRPGKVPMRIIRQQYGDRVRDEVIGSLIQSSLPNALREVQLMPVSTPEITLIHDDNDQLEYLASFEILPDVTPTPVAGVAIEREVCAISEEDLALMIETLRKQRMQWRSDSERAAEHNDRVTFDYTGTINGEPFSGNKGSGLKIVIGEGRMIDGFEDGLIGAKADSEITLDLHFPANYGATELAGKAVNFAVKVVAVEVGELPVVDAEFAKEFGIDDGDLEKMYSEVKANMQRELDIRLKQRAKEAVIEKLLELNSVEIPSKMVANESQKLLEHFKQNMQVPQGKSGVDLQPSMFTEQAERRLKLGLLFSTIIKANNLVTDPERVRAHVEGIASTYEDAASVIDWYYDDKERLAEVEGLVMEENVVNWALDQMAVTDKPIQFSELMARG
ncbi:MAG: trigger factor [Gammaproteobacteria bacterium]|nr:trigger factor [Gammaproteobacteria bacterium]